MGKEIDVNRPTLRWEGLFYLIAFVTGAAGLIYEVLWNRYLLLLLGSTTYAAAGILAVFIGALALGSFWGVRAVCRFRQPLVIYAALQAVIALSALAVAYGVQFMGQINYLASQFGPAAAKLAMLIALLSLLLPTICMGASFPLLVLARKVAVGESAKAPALFYGWDTLGAVLGAMSAGFLLIPQFGMRMTLWSGILLSLFAMAAAIFLYQRHHTGSEIVAYDRHIKSKGADPGSSITRVLLVSIFLAGVASLGYEIIWTRILVLIIGSSTYAFTLTVSVFILGIAVGSLWISRHIQRFRSPLEVFIHTQIGVAILAFFTLYLYGQMPAFYVQLLNSHSSPSAVFLSQLLMAGLIMLPPTLLIGASFPLAVQLLDAGYAAQERSFGMAFGSISAGNMLGLALTTFLLIPLLGLQKSTIALGLINLSVAALLVFSLIVIRGRRLLAALIAAIAAVALMLPPQWDAVLMTSGVYTKLPLYQQLTGSQKSFRNLLKLHRLRYYKESNQNVVSVVEMPAINAHSYYALAIDGKVDASTGNADMNTQVLSGHIPFIFGTEPQQVLVIGLASGITAGAVSLHSPQKLSVVEIEPAMREAAAVFQDFNHGLLNNPRVELILDDGRHYLNFTEQKYDLIISQPSNPWMSGPSRLFTWEFYHIVRNRLESGGLFVQWVPLYGMGKGYFTSLIRTYREVFPYVLAWQVSPGDLLLIGSDDEVEISTRQLAALFDHPLIRTDLERVGVGTPGALLQRYIGTEAILEAISSQARLNTDDNGFVEFGAPKSLYQNTLRENLALLEQWQRVPDILARVSWDVREIYRLELLADFGEQLLANANEPTLEALTDYLNRQGDPVAAAYLAALLAEHRHDEPSAILQYKRVIQQTDASSNAFWRLIQLHLKSDRVDAAEEMLAQIPVPSRTTDFYYWQGLVYLRQNKPRRALTSFSKADASRLNEAEIFYFLYKFVSAQRTANSRLTDQHEIEFRRALKDLRQAAENDLSLEQIQSLINTVQADRNTWLTNQEQGLIENILVDELLSPLQFYNNGINALLAGNFEEAETSFGRALRGLSNSGATSKAVYFLELIKSSQKN